MSGTQQPEALRLARKFEEVGFMGDHRFAKDHWCRQAAAELRHQHARIAELEAQLSAIGAGGVEPLRKQAAQAAVQAEVPEAIEQMAVERYKVVPSHESMFHRWAVVAGNGTQQLYIGREGPIPARTGQPVAVRHLRCAVRAYPRSHGATFLCRDE